METHQTPDWLTTCGVALPAGSVIDAIRVEVLYTRPEETDGPVADEPAVATGSGAGP